MMRRPLLPLVLAAVIGAMPLAHEICDIACAEPTAASAPHASHGAGNASPADEMAHQHGGHQAAGEQAGPSHHHPHAAPAGQPAAAAASGGLTAVVTPACCAEADQSLSALAAAVKAAFHPPAIAIRLPDLNPPATLATVARPIGAATGTPIPSSRRTPLRV